MDVASLDPIQHHVVQMGYVVANQMLLATNVQLVIQVIMDFPIVQVKSKTFQKHKSSESVQEQEI